MTDAFEGIGGGMWFSSSSRMNVKGIFFCLSPYIYEDILDLAAADISAGICCAVSQSRRENNKYTQ